MFSRLYMKIMQYRLFWRLRTAWMTTAFWAAKTRYRLRARNRSGFQAATTFWAIFSQTKSAIILAAVVGIALHLVGYLIARQYPWFDLPEQKEDTYATLLGAVASICGVFIALYYTAIATVGASIYAVVPNDIRYLLNRDRAGNLYLKFLSFLAYLGLFLIAAHIYGLRPSWLALVFVSVCSGVGVFAFVYLGQHAFNLFDPTKLAGTIFRDMHKELEAAMLGGYRWWDGPFQNAARQRMDRQLRTLSTLSDYVASKQHLRTASYPELAAGTVRFLMYYQRAKRAIPANSAWYEPRPVYRDWYRAHYSDVKVAVETGTSLSHVQDRDPLWVERRLLPILYTYVSCSVEQGNLDDLSSMGGLVQEYLEVLFQDGEITRGAQVLGELGEAVFKTIRAVPAAEATKLETSLKILGVAELLAAMPVFSIVTYRDALPQFQPHAIGRKLAGIRWNRKESIYKAELPARLLPEAEDLVPKLAFERAVYDRQITPDWYILDLFMAMESGRFVENGKLLVGDVPNLYQTWKDLAKSMASPWAYMVILSREWEYVHKLGHFLGVYKQAGEKAVVARKTTSLRWKDASFGDLEKLHELQWRKLLVEMSGCARTYASVERPQSYPDCVGQFMHAVADGILAALLANDVEMLKVLYASYQTACFVRYSHMDLSKFTDIDVMEREFRAVGAIVLDLFDLSGYAKLLAEYHKNPELWKVVTDAWDGYFSGDRREVRIKHLATLLKTVDDQVGVTQREILRTNWEIAVNHFLSKLPTHHEPWPVTEGSPLRPPEEVVGHDSAMVRLIAKEMNGLSIDGIDIFAAYYLEPLSTPLGIEMPGKYTDFKEYVDNEEDAGRRRRSKKPEETTT